MPPLRALPPEGVDPASALELASAWGLSPPLAATLWALGLRSRDAAEDFLRPRLQDLSPPHAVRGLQAAVDAIMVALRSGHRIAIFGDYDVDGTTAAALLDEVLSDFGGDVHTHLAQRFHGGYGLSSAALERCLQSRPQLLITCDCGSTDHERIREARRRGIDVIVVDHHRVPDEPLEVLAFLNPHQPGCEYPYKHLTSVGLCFMLAAALRAAMQRQYDLRRCLDLVALGTVADVAPLDGDNRRLVRAGLQRLASTEARPGILALRRKAAGGESPPMTAREIAFRLAPRLNASGRLGDPRLSFNLLRCRDMQEAKALASSLEEINERRRGFDRKVSESAFAQVEARYPTGELPAGLVVAGEGWHRGVLGISAARLVERFQRPVLLLGIETGQAEGSGRAPKGFPLYDALAACEGLLERFGGHQAAVGLSVDRHRLDALQADFAEACAQRRAEAAAALEAGGATPGVELHPEHCPPPSAAELQLLEPLGGGSEVPIFRLPGAEVEDKRVVAGDHLKLRLRFGSHRISAFAANQASALASLPSRLTAIGPLAPDVWRNDGSVELTLQTWLAD